MGDNNSDVSDMSIASKITSVLQRIEAVHKLSGRRDTMPKLVAVSKTKPVEAIIEGYIAGQRHFGENYVQELVEKSQNEKLLSACPDIKWHFIGNLQKNKVNKMPQIKNLHVVETVDSKQLADLLEKAYSRLSSQVGETGEKNILNVMVEVNTSEEEQKNGIQPVEAVDLANHIRTNCRNLNFTGFMTIGALDSSLSNVRPNPDFAKLVTVRQKYCEATGQPQDTVELSMGMSSDFEHAVEMGSTSVRVGSIIFGERNYS